jgi:hypothetical protein
MPELVSIASSVAVDGPSVAPLVPHGPRETAAGQPIQRFLKDVIAVGLYEHRNGTLDIDVPALDEFAAAFEQMRAAGVDIELTKDHSDSASDVLGYVTSMWRDGDRLWVVVEARGWDAIDLCGRVKNVSVEIAKNYVDGKGREYGRAIYAVSIVKGPVVAGQGEFIRASKGQAGVPVLKLSRVGTIKGTAGESRWLSKQGGTGMDAAALVAALATAFGVQNLTAENAVAELSKVHEATKKAAADAQTSLSQIRTELDGFKAAAGKPAQLSAEQLEAIEDRAETQTDAILSLEGKVIEITKDVAGRLAEAICGKPGGRNVMLMSRAAGGVIPGRQLVDVLKATAKQPAAALSRGGGQALGGGAAGTSKTGAQEVHLSRAGGGGAAADAGGGDPSQAAIDAELKNYERFLELDKPKGG